MLRHTIDRSALLLCHLPAAVSYIPCFSCVYFLEPHVSLLYCHGNIQEHQLHPASTACPTSSTVVYMTVLNCLWMGRLVSNSRMVDSPVKAVASCLVHACDMYCRLMHHMRDNAFENSLRSIIINSLAGSCQHCCEFQIGHAKLTSFVPILIPRHHWGAHTVSHNTTCTTDLFDSILCSLKYATCTCTWL